MLRNGSRGQGVKELQTLLNAKIIPSPRLEADGVYGPRTYQSVMAFQRQSRIKVDGIAGPQTIAALKAAGNFSRPQPTGMPGKPGWQCTTGQSNVLDSIANAAAGVAATGLGPQGLSLLKEIEQLRLTPYDDQTGKAINKYVAGATIGYGHLISSIEWNTYKGGITEAQAESLLRQDLSPFESTVKTAITKKLNQHQFDACVILAFNIGASGFRNSSVAKMINGKKSNYSTLEKAWKAWNKSQGKVMQGLNNRRDSEWNIYNSGIYKMW